MELHFDLTPAASLLGAERWQGLGHDWRALAWLGLVQVAFVLAAWLAARTFVPRREMNSFGQYDRREGGGLGKAILLYLGYLALAALLFVIIRATGTACQLALLTLVSHPTRLGAKWIAIFALCAPVVLALKLGLPMAIFRVRLPRACGLLLFIALLVAGAGWALDLALGHPVEQGVAIVRGWAAQRDGGSGAGLLNSVAARAEQEVVFAAAERAGADPSKPMHERKEAIRSLFTQLEETRAHLPEDDAAALADYNQKKARYEAVYQKLKAEIAAHPELAE